VYIGSSINIAQRLVDHAVENNTNVRLQNAITKYGLGNFTFAVVDIFQVDPDVSMETNKARLLALEQVYLNWGFTLPKKLCYNINPIANSRLGATHSEETRVKISISMTGKTHSDEGAPFQGKGAPGR